MVRLARFQPQNMDDDHDDGFFYAYTLGLAQYMSQGGAFSDDDHDDGFFAYSNRLAGSSS